MEVVNEIRAALAGVDQSAGGGKASSHQEQPATIDVSFTEDASAPSDAHAAASSPPSSDVAAEKEAAARAARARAAALKAEAEAAEAEAEAVRERARIAPPPGSPAAAGDAGSPVSSMARDGMPAQMLTLLMSDPELMRRIQNPKVQKVFLYFYFHLR